MTYHFVLLSLVATSVVTAPLLAQRAEPTSLPPLKVIDVRYMNRKANACADFNEFANGTWLATDTIPAAYANTGVGRDMGDRNELVVRSVLYDAMKKRASLPPASTERKLGTYYASCMDSAAAERAGLSSIKPELDSIDAMRTRADLVRQIAAAHMRGIDVAFGYGPDVDPHDAQHYLGGFGAGGLGLPDRDYYTKKDPSSDSLRTSYVNHIAKMLSMTGESDATARADAQKILALETELANATLTRVDRRDPSAVDHPMTLAKFHELAPNIDWTQYFHDVGLGVPAKKLNVAEPKFYEELNTLVASTPMETWKAYLRFHTVSDAARWLSTPFV